MMPCSEVTVVGGGPVGLLLGCRLAQLGIPFVIFEKHLGPSVGSRAIGIHPPSLERLSALGLAPRFLEEGVKVSRAHARSSRGLLGSVDLSRRPGPFRFALSLPQPTTERILEEALTARAPGALRRGCALLSLEPKADRVALTVRARDGTVHAHCTRWLVACDGHDSLVRRTLGIAMPGTARPESYLMGDFSDDTPFGDDAVIYLADGGLVESFPLPQRIRRWVVEAPGPRREARGDEIAALVCARTGVTLRADSARMTSAFGVEQRLAAQLFRGRVVLAGDAAHVVSPFGAQGMNLGWQGAWHVAAALEATTRGADPLPALARYQREQRAAARRAMRRASLNGFVGRRRRAARLRNGVVRTLLYVLPDTLLACLFTMAPLTSTMRRAPEHRDMLRP